LNTSQFLQSSFSLNKKLIVNHLSTQILKTFINSVNTIKKEKISNFLESIFFIKLIDNDITKTQFFNGILIPFSFPIEINQNLKNYFENIKNEFNVIIYDISLNENKILNITEKEEGNLEFEIKLEKTDKNQIILKKIEKYINLLKKYDIKIVSSQKIIFPLLKLLLIKNV
jgi:chaperonin GroEL (HSP60 family)